MAQLTSLVPSPRDATRIRIRVDGRTVATLNHKLVADLGLQVGQVWDDATAAAVRDAAAYDQALRDAMKRLNQRLWSTRRLARKLSELEHAPAIVQRVCDRLTELGVLDDAALGRSIIRAQLAQKPAGPALLRRKLMQRGLERQLIDQLLTELRAEPTHDPTAAALTLARKRWATLRKLPAPVAKRRLWGLLARRGFDLDVVQQVMEQVVRDGEATT